MNHPEPENNKKNQEHEEKAIKSAAEIAYEKSQQVDHDSGLEILSSDDSFPQKQEDEETESFKNKYLRIRADLENIQRRAREERESMRLNTLANFLRELLPFIDNMSRALQAAENDGSDLAQGLKMNWTVLENILKTNNIQKIPTHDGFDPNLHEALTQIEDTGVPEGTIKTVIEEGYQIGEKIIRHTKVQVTTGGPQRDISNEPSSIDTKA